MVRCRATFVQILAKVAPWMEKFFIAGIRGANREESSNLSFCADYVSMVIGDWRKICDFLEC